jgi:peptide deformylase
MAILKIARMGHPVLDRIADPVADPTAPEIRRLAADMIETMHDAPGIGLAAPQVHVPLRLVVFFLPDGRAEGGGGVPVTVLANPLIEPLDDDVVSGWEGCLSVPGLRGEVPRFRRIRYSGVTPEGERIERVAEGMHARVVQHECDHLDGMLYPRRMADIRNLVFESELRYRLSPAATVMED